MKRFLGLSAVLPLAFLLHAADPVVHVEQAKVAGAGTFAKSSGYSTAASRRDKAGEVEVHEKETDIMYFTDGEATMLTGGTIVGDRVISPGQHRGTGIDGGQTFKVQKGDVVVVPAGAPHWFKEVPKSVSYILTKVMQP